MTAHDDAVKAAAEALSEYYEGDGWGYFGGAAEAAVAAAAPILLAAERARYGALVADLRRLSVNGGIRHSGEQRWFTVGDLVAVLDRIADTAPEEGP